MHQVDVRKPGRIASWLTRGKHLTGDADFDARFLVVEDGLPRDGWLDAPTRKAIARFLDEAPVEGVLWIREGELLFTMQHPRGLPPMVPRSERCSNARMRLPQRSIVRREFDSIDQLALRRPLGHGDVTVAATNGRTWHWSRDARRSESRSPACGGCDVRWAGCAGRRCP